MLKSRCRKFGVWDEHFTSRSATLPRKGKTHSQSLWNKSVWSKAKILAKAVTPICVWSKRCGKAPKKTVVLKQLHTCVNAKPNLQCTDDKRSYRNVCNMSFVSFSLVVNFIIRLFSTSAFRVLNLKKVWERRSHALPCHYTPAYTHNMWRDQVKTYTHIYATYVSFWELIIAYPNGGQWAPFRKVCPPWLKPLVTPLATVCIKSKDALT